MPRNKPTPVKISNNENNNNDDNKKANTAQNKANPPSKRQKIEHEEVEDDDEQDEDYEDEEADLFQIIAKVTKEDEWESILLDGTELSDTVLRNTAMNSFLSSDNISEKQIRQRIKQIQDREKQQIQITKLQQQIMMSQRLQGGILGSFGLLADLGEDDMNEENEDDFSNSPVDEKDSENQNDNQLLDDFTNEEEEELENVEENESNDAQQNPKKKVTKFQLNSAKAKSNNTDQGKPTSQKKRKGPQ